MSKLPRCWGSLGPAFTSGGGGADKRWLVTGKTNPFLVARGVLQREGAQSEKEEN